MDDNHYILARDASISIPMSDADKLIANADGDSALLYLQILKNNGVYSPELAERELGFTALRTSDALRTLDRLGILTKSPGKLAPAPELPEYSAEEITLRSEGVPAFKAVVGEIQRMFGRMLSSSELKTVFAIYDYLALPPEVILVLINHCVEEARERYGEGRIPTMRSIEKEAYLWTDKEIITLERAEEYIRRKKDRKDVVAQVMDILQIRGREPSKSERQYIEAWLDMGFTANTLEIAYDRTVVKTGKLTWKYMDSIIRSWHSKSLHSPEEIESGDVRSDVAQRAPASETVNYDNDYERMKKMLDRIQKG